MSEFPQLVSLLFSFVGQQFLHQQSDCVCNHSLLARSMRDELSDMVGGSEGKVEEGPGEKTSLLPSQLFRICLRLYPNFQWRFSIK